MSGFNYRFSVIPAGAITDARLSPRALQVLCLLGRHTNDNGWCSRSQVKMAKELGCGRSTMYEAIGELLDAGWVEKKANGRGSTGPETSEHPFAAFSYRVLLDRDDLPERVKTESSPDNDAPEGAAIPAGGAAQAAGGAAIPAPLEGISSKGISPEPERERARARGLLDFKKKWPTTIYDDPAKVDTEWNGLPDEDWPKALQFIEAYLAGLKRLKRTHIPAGQRYLHDRPWVHTPAEIAPTLISFEAFSKDWWAQLFAKADRHESLAFHIHQAVNGKHFTFKSDAMPSVELRSSLRSFRANGNEIAAWRPWLLERGADLPKWTESFWIFLPSPEPPVAGTPALRITGPPVAA